MENRFKVVYTGELQPYVTAQEAIRNVASMFKMSDDSVRALVLAGRAQDVKVNLDRVTAERYVSALSKAGLSVRSEPMVRPTTDLHLAPVNVEEAVAVALDTQVETCPKCGSPNLHAGVCQDCGVVAAKYLARQAAATANAAQSNPYAPPVSELTPDIEAMEDESMSGPQGVPAGHGWGWIARGFRYFTAYPWSWILALVVFIVCIALASLVPLLGMVATYLLSPVFAGGLMLGLYEQDHGGRFRVSHVFAGFSNHLGQLSVLGALYLGGIVLILIPAFLPFGLPDLTIFGMELPPIVRSGLARQPHHDGQLLYLLLGLLASMLLTIPLMMAYWFAPALIAINGMRAWPAMKLSFRGCLRNLLPFLVYGFAAMVLMLATLLTLGLAMFVLLPVLIASIYAAYRDIYYDRLWAR